MKRLFLLLAFVFLFALPVVSEAACIKTDTGHVEFFNSPTNGTDTDFQVFYTCHHGFVTYFQNATSIEPDTLHVYFFEMGFAEINPEDYSINQTNGVVTMDVAPPDGTFIYFNIFEPTEDNFWRAG